MTNKEKAVGLIRSLETGDKEPIGFINPTKYIQHNLLAEDGLAGFGKLLSTVPERTLRAKVVRAFEDGDFVFLHTEYNFFGPKVGFDIFRFENGLIVEHWDNLQEIALKNHSGRSMIDGTFEITDLEKTSENKNLIKNFVTDVLGAGKMEKISEYFEGDHYIQHNPYISDGISGLTKALEDMNTQGITMAYEKTHIILGEGNFVLAVSEGKFAGENVSFYDLFRIENGKIGEHWDTLETLLPKEKQKNKNGKFGF